MRDTNRKKANNQYKLESFYYGPMPWNGNVVDDQFTLDWPHAINRGNLDLQSMCYFQLPLYRTIVDLEIHKNVNMKIISFEVSSNYMTNVKRFFSFKTLE